MTTAHTNYPQVTDPRPAPVVCPKCGDRCLVQFTVRHDKPARIWCETGCYSLDLVLLERAHKARQRAETYEREARTHSKGPAESYAERVKAEEAPNGEATEAEEPT